MVRFPDPADEPEAVAGLRHRLWEARPPDATPPAVFAGYARPLLTNDPRYRAAVAGQPVAPAALLGRAVDVARSSATVPFGPAAGRNLAVLGPRPGACRLLATAAHSTAAHHAEGTARFVVAAPDVEAGPLADALVAELAGRHRVDRVDLAGLVAVADAGEPAYLVVFGLDVAPAEQLPPARLRALLRDGPPAGQHLLGWWRTVPSFATLMEPDETVDKLTAVAVAGVPGAQLTPVFGRQVEWRPRPDRVVLWDGPAERGVVLVPYDVPASAEGNPDDARSLAGHRRRAGAAADGRRTRGSGAGRVGRLPGRGPATRRGTPWRGDRRGRAGPRGPGRPGGADRGTHPVGTAGEPAP
ncbi:hypothetical protein GCM10029963_51910 [Micromonospora andamanensis]